MTDIKYMQIGKSRYETGRKIIKDEKLGAVLIKK